MKAPIKGGNNIIKSIKSVKSIILLFIMIMFVTTVAAPQAQAAYLGDRLLVYSMQGYDVQQLQKNLSYLNYYHGNIDGIFGSQTLAAVKQYQVQYGLMVDGMVGKQTAWSLINEVSKPQPGSATPSRGAILRSSPDMECLARTIYGEARGEPYEGKVAVAAVVLNRLESGLFGNSIHEVVFQRGAFTAISDGQYYLTPDSTSYQAARAALQGWDPTNGALYYWNPITATSKWIWSRPIIKTIGRHVFAY